MSEDLSKFHNSRAEKDLSAIINNDESLLDKVPKSRMEELLIMLYNKCEEQDNKITELNSKLGNLGTVRYNEDVDMVQLLFNGVWTDWQNANMKSFYIFKDGAYQNQCGTSKTFDTAVTISNNMILNMQPSGVFAGINITVPDIIAKIVEGKKLHMVCKLDKVDNTNTLSTIIGAANTSKCTGYTGIKITTIMAEYVYDLSTCGFSESSPYLFIGLYSYVGCPKYNFYIESMWLG